jgi:hypothetical protein
MFNFFKNSFIVIMKISDPIYKYWVTIYHSIASAFAEFYWSEFITRSTRAMPLQWEAIFFEAQFILVCRN